VLHAPGAVALHDRRRALHQLGDDLAAAARVRVLVPR
jgi:hypothetical protein